VYGRSRPSRITLKNAVIFDIVTWYATCSKDDGSMAFVLPGNARELRFTGEAKALAPKQDASGALALGKPRLRKPPPPPAAAARVRPPPLGEHLEAPTRGRHVKTPTPGERPHAPPRGQRLQAPAPGQRVHTPPPGAHLHTVRSGPDLYRNERMAAPSVGSVDDRLVRHKLDEWVERRPTSDDNPWGAPRDGLEDEHPTMTLDREALDVLPGGHAIRARNPSPPTHAAPIPHFRRAPPAMPPPRTIIVPGTASSRIESSRVERPETTRAPLAAWILGGVVAAIVSYYVAPELVTRLEPPNHAAQER
jgi:hypothetical protein